MNRRQFLMDPGACAELERQTMHDLKGGQSRRESFVEACINTAIGYLVALASQLIVFPLFDIHVPLSTNLWIGAWFTIISVARGYVLRRWFNKRIAAAIHRAMGGQ